jgi:hypothetical protein
MNSLIHESMYIASSDECVIIIQECVNKDFAKITETPEIRNEHMNVHMDFRLRNVRSQGAQCAPPKVRNVRSPRCAM